MLGGQVSDIQCGKDVIYHQMIMKNESKATFCMVVVDAIFLQI